MPLLLFLPSNGYASEVKVGVLIGVLLEPIVDRLHRVRRVLGEP